MTKYPNHSIPYLISITPTNLFRIINSITNHLIIHNIPLINLNSLIKTNPYSMSTLQIIYQLYPTYSKQRTNNLLHPFSQKYNRLKATLSSYSVMAMPLIQEICWIPIWIQLINSILIYLLTIIRVMVRVQAPPQILIHSMIQKQPIPFQFASLDSVPLKLFSMASVLALDLRLLSHLNQIILQADSFSIQAYQVDYEYSKSRCRLHNIMISTPISILSPKFNALS